MGKSNSAVRPGRLLAAILVAVAVSLAAAGSVAAKCGQSAPSVNPQTGKLELNLGNCVGPNEAWTSEYNSAVSQGTFYPDTSANYWLASVPSVAGQSAHWEFRGSMPDARFSSLQTYTLTGETMGSVFDQNIEASSGSVNWIRDSGIYPDASAVQYVVPGIQVPQTTSVAKSSLRIDDDTLDGSSPLKSAAAVAYRVYPNTKSNGSTPSAGLSQSDWISRGQTDLPDVVYVVDNPAGEHFTSRSEIVAKRSGVFLVSGLLKVIEAIGDSVAPVLSAYPQATNKLWSDPVNWEANVGLSTNLRKMFNPKTAPLANALWGKLDSALPDFTAFPNDATRYFVGGVNPGYGQVLVTRFKAPTVPEPDNGDALSPDSSSSQQLRYWSACLNNTLTVYVTGCIKDSEFEVGVDGFVTLVASSTASAPKGSDGARAANWLKHGSPNELLLIRQTLPSTSFHESIVYYSGSATDTQAIAAHSGDYYPVSVYCSLANYRYNDCRWKFSAAQERFYAVAPSLFARVYPR